MNEQLWHVSDEGRSYPCPGELCWKCASGEFDPETDLTEGPGLPAEKILTELAHLREELETQRDRANKAEDGWAKSIAKSQQLQQQAEEEFAVLRAQLDDSAEDNTLAGEEWDKCRQECNELSHALEKADRRGAVLINALKLIRSVALDTSQNTFLTIANVALTDLDPD